jgi:hypothetical protein
MLRYSELAEKKAASGGGGVTESALMLSLVALSNSSQDTNFDSGSPDLAKFRYAGILAQIEVISCFRDDFKSLFPLIESMIPNRHNPRVNWHDWHVSRSLAGWHVCKEIGSGSGEWNSSECVTRNWAALRCGREMIPTLPFRSTSHLPLDSR